MKNNWFKDWTEFNKFFSEFNPYREANKNSSPEFFTKDFYENDKLKFNTTEFNDQYNVWIDLPSDIDVHGIESEIEEYRVPSGKKRTIKLIIPKTK